MPTVDLTTALTFAEGGAAKFVDPNFIVSGGGSYTEGYIEFAVSSPSAGDNFVLTSAADPNASGAISVENGDVFLGNGSGRERIGSIDQTYNGEDGQPLRILFASPLPNSGFEEGESNWDIRDERYGDDGSELNLDNYTIQLANDSDYTGGTGTTNTQDPSGISFDGTVQSGSGIDGSKALYLNSRGNIIQGDQVPMGSGFQQDGYGSIHGPYATSEVISVQSGDSITLDFRAVGSGDDYEVFGFLRRVDANGNFVSNDVNDTTNNINLFAQRGNDTNGYVSISETNLPAGEYRFEFVGGTYDGSGGYAVGSNLYVDNIRLISSTTVNDSVVQQIARQVTYQNDADDAVLSRQITVTAVDANGVSGSDSDTLTFVAENDSPTISSVWTAVNEDEVPVGASVGSMVGNTLSDPDNSQPPYDSLAGIVVTGDASTPAQGEWQYSTNGTDWFSIGAVSGTEGLVLSAATSIRFLPAEDWNGNPGSLTVHGIDSSYVGSFTTGATRTLFDTTTDDPVTSAVSDSGATVSMTVNSVNDAPVFTSVPQELSVADTSALDDPAPLTGTITASDLHDGAPGEGGAVTFGILGGTSSNGITSVTNVYGTLSINETTGDYSFDVNELSLNALPAGASLDTTFAITISDGQTGISSQSLTVNLTGANDAPVANGHAGIAVEAAGVNNDVPGTDANGDLINGSNADFDPDLGDSISVTNVRTGDLNGSGADGVWNGTTVTLTGTYGDLTLQENGTWSYSVDNSNPAVDGLVGALDTLTDTFTYTITDANGLSSSAELAVTIEGRNDDLVVSSSIRTEYDVQEDVDTQIDLSGLTFEDPDLGSEVYEIAFAAAGGSLWTGAAPGLSIDGNGTGSLVLTGSATAISDWIASNSLTYRSPINSDGADAISVSYGEEGAQPLTLLEMLDVTVDVTNDSPVIDTNGSVAVQGDGTTAEVSSITFVPATDAQSLVFDGVTLSIDAASTAEEIAEAFAQQNLPNWTAVHEGGGRVTLTATTPGDRPDLTGADFTDGNGALSALVDTAGGFDGHARFTARGEAVAIAPELELADVDSGILSSATITMNEDVFDNDFGTTYESLSLSSAAQTAATTAGIAVTITTTASGSVITLTGDADVSDYETVLRGVMYNNENPNAVAGTRPVTIEVTDSEGLTSNLAAVELTEGNTDIAVGQRILVDGVDSGQVVASVNDAMSFVASGELTDLESGAVLSFADDTGLVTTAVAASDAMATVSVDVVWAPVIDMNGFTGTGNDHTVTYIEQQAPLAVATSDASMVDQDGLIRSLDVELTNPLDNESGEPAVEFIGIRKAVLDVLAARGITVGDHDGVIDPDGNLTGATQIGFVAANGATATNFQIALRGVTYSNVDDAPDATTRVVTAQSVDMDGNVGAVSQTEINPLAVNDAPVGVDSAVTGAEDTGHVFASTDFGFTDPLDEGANTLASVTIDTLPADGQLLLNGEAIQAGTTVTQAQLDAGALVYVPSADVNGAEIADFTFRVQDDGGLANGGQDTDPVARTMSISLDPANDAPVLVTGTTIGTPITEDEVDNLGQLVSDLLGTVTDVDTGTHASDNGTLSGMAVSGVGADGIGGGQWQYSLDSGDHWADITLAEGEVLLLSGDDRVRFVPDEENATEAQLTYHAWDESTGSAGDVVPGIAGPDNLANRGGTTAFSVDAADVTIEVTALNDAPVAEVDAGNTFYARGMAVGLFDDAGLTLGDVDDGARLSEATLVLDTNTAIDNAFGQTYETIFSEAGGSLTTEGGATLTISGNGTEADPIVISGDGSMADYREALLSLRYENTNPNLFAGDREISLEVRDDTGAPSLVDTFSLPVEWATVADLNGPTQGGRDHSVTYTEGGNGVAIATADAELIDQEGSTVEVVISLTDAVRPADERLVIEPSVMPTLHALGVMVSGDGTDEIRLTNPAGLDPTYFQLALRAIRYVNDSSAPTDAARHVTVTSTDADGNPGVAATTVIGIETVNDAPVSTYTLVNETSSTRDALTGDVLSLTGTVTDADGIPGEVALEWLRDGIVIATGPQYILQPADAGHEISARISYLDGEGNSESVDVGTAGTVGAFVVGTELGDVLQGSDGNDVLLGMDGDDTVEGGFGSDDIQGQADNDTVDYSGMSGPINVSMLGTSGDGFVDKFTTGTGGGGTASGPQGLVGTDTLSGVEAVIGTAFNDSFVGDEANDTFSGGAGNDSIAGGGGADTLFGNTGGDLLQGDDGDDWMHGGKDNDILNGGIGADTLGGGLGDDILDGGDGLDTASFATAQNGVTVDLAKQGITQDTGGTEGNDVLISIENLEGGRFADLLYGDAFANVIDGAEDGDEIWGRDGNDTIGGGDGGDLLYGNTGDDLIDGEDGDDWMHGGKDNDVLNGGIGADTLGGGLGDDALNGGDGLDTATYLSAHNGVSVDLGIQGTGQDVGGTEGIDTLTSIENLEGSGFADLLFGDGSANVIDGAGDGDEIWGRDGNDTLEGGDGADTIYGNTGDDLIEGEDGDDWLHGGKDNDILNGGIGADTLGGGMGDDALNGGDGSDTASYMSAHNGVTVDLAIQGVGQDVGGTEGIDTLTSIENLEGGGLSDMLLGDDGGNVIDGARGNDEVWGRGGADTLVGGDGADRIYGNTGDDLIEGGEGDDWLHGGKDNDILNGGIGADTLGGGMGDDALNGGDGSDTASYMSAHNGVTVDLAIQGTGQDVGGTEGVDTLTSIENLEGSGFADLLFGDGSANMIDGAGDGDEIWGRSGNDSLDGGEGADTIYGNVGDDLIEGGEGDDWLHGGQDDDILIGGVGADTVEGGRGEDILTGGDDADVFVFRYSDGSGDVDQITDFEQGADQIALAGHLADIIQAANVDVMDALLWDAGTGSLSVDLETLGGSGTLQIAQIDNDGTLSLTDADFFLL